MNYKEIEIEASNGETVKTVIIELGDGAFKSFPADPTNPEYVAFLKSLEEETSNLLHSKH